MSSEIEEQQVPDPMTMAQWEIKDLSDANSTLRSQVTALTEALRKAGAINAQLEHDCSAYRLWLWEFSKGVPTTPHNKVQSAENLLKNHSAGKQIVDRLDDLKEALRKAKGALEFVNVSDHNGDGGIALPFHRKQCHFCRQVDAALAHINKVLE